ncbi:uncharacterized protein PITG_22041 [Phytophthora infestans T30-4]|uniref:Uncharacterized protein n=1 Tax=Phytophthora infestans (strain T30-4) TaxID=403677 RepID=D0RLU1_PHYIT|nr:uncharacterized protein PITG_22041 [Phytophthora infestans T30-4]EEY70268.1 conserved hypothetical protein [Phytophthora infestans T30-4]|eukprot:XP_002999320.1 conserved hypothetical protein [Phytophthora infestans T30-4]
MIRASAADFVTKNLKPRKWKGLLAVGPSMVCSTAQSATSPCRNLTTSASSSCVSVTSVLMAFSTKPCRVPMSSRVGGINVAAVGEKISCFSTSRCSESASTMPIEPPSRSRYSVMSFLVDFAFHRRWPTAPFSS